MAIGTTLVNGVNYSWSDITVAIFGVPVKGITKINYKRSTKKENQYGAGSEPISRASGNTEYEASLELYVDEWKAIKRAAPGGDPLRIPPFDIIVAYGNSPANATVDRLKMCEFTEDPFNAQQGDTRLLVTIPLVIAGIQAF